MLRSADDFYVSLESSPEPPALFEDRRYGGLANLLAHATKQLGRLAGGESLLGRGLEYQRLSGGISPKGLLFQVGE